MKIRSALMAILMTSTCVTSFAQETKAQWQTLNAIEVDRIGHVCRPSSAELAIGTAAAGGGLALFASGSVATRIASQLVGGAGAGSFGGAGSALALIGGYMFVIGAQSVFVNQLELNEFLMLIDDLQNGVETNRTEKLRSEAQVNGLSYQEALDLLNKAARNSTICSVSEAADLSDRK